MATRSSPSSTPSSPSPPPPQSREREREREAQSQQIPGGMQLQLQGDKMDAAALEDATNLALTAPAPVREDQVQNAIRFLSHPKVRGSPVLYRRSFLEKKGLTKEEIDEAFRRVPDPPPSAATNAQPPPSTQTQVVQPNPSTPLPTPAPQLTAVMAPALVKRTFNWYHIVLATGILAAGGTGTVVFFKRVLVPRIKSWIKKVVSEREDAKEEEEKSSKVAEEAAEAAKAAASAAAIVAKASQDLLSSKSEEKGYFEAFMRALDVQVKEMKLMGETIRKLENKRENGVLEDQLHHSATRNGPVSSVWGAQPVNTNGISTADYARPSSAPGSSEHVNYKSYMEMMSMGPQKSERASAAKPWETAPLLPNQRPTYPHVPSHSSDDGSNPEIQESVYAAASSYPVNGTKISSTTTDSSSEPWWRKKSVLTAAEADPKSDELKQFSYGSAGYDAGSSQTQVQQRRWVPPQPPPVVMPEAAAAIRHLKPKSSPILDEGADGAAVKVDDATVRADGVAVKPDDVVPSSEGVGAFEVAPGPGNGVNQIVEEEKVDAVEANQA